MHNITAPNVSTSINSTCPVHTSYIYLKSCVHIHVNMSKCVSVWYRYGIAFQLSSASASNDFFSQYIKKLNRSTQTCPSTSIDEATTTTLWTTRNVRIHHSSTNWPFVWYLHNQQRNGKTFWLPRDRSFKRTRTDGTHKPFSIG